MISETITKLINEAMKNKDALRVSTLRLLASELHNAKIDKREALSEEEELQVVKKEVKKRRDAIELYEKAGRQELSDKEKAELKILQEFLPEQLTPEELETIVDETLKQFANLTINDLGKVIGLVLAKVGGRADGKQISDLVRQKLSKLP